MDKPITVIVEDTKRELINALNTSGLPPFVLEYIMRDLYKEVAELANKTANEERQAYNASKEEE